MIAAAAGKNEPPGYGADDPEHKAQDDEQQDPEKRQTADEAQTVRRDWRE